MAKTSCRLSFPAEEDDVCSAPTHCCVCPATVYRVLAAGVPRPNPLSHPDVFFMLLFIIIIILMLYCLELRASDSAPLLLLWRCLHVKSQPLTTSTPMVKPSSLKRGSGARGSSTRGRSKNISISASEGIRAALPSVSLLRWHPPPSQRHSTPVHRLATVCTVILLSPRHLCYAYDEQSMFTAHGPCSS